MVTVPTVLIISTDAVLVIEHEGKADFASHIVVILSPYCADRLVISSCRCRGRHVVKAIIAVITVPPAVVYEDFKAPGPVFQIYGVSCPEIVMKTIIRTEGSTESIAFRRFRPDDDYRFHVGSIRRAGISYYRDILYVIRIELSEFLNVADLATVDVDCRCSFAEYFQFSVILHHHRHTFQHVVGCTCDGERASIDIGDERISFHCC